MRCALPLMAIAPVADPAALRAAWRSWRRLPRRDVRQRQRGAAFLRRTLRRRRLAGAGTRAWATGPGHARGAAASGRARRAIDAPPPSAAQFDSETLWRQVAAQVRPGDRVLIVRGGDAEGASSGPRLAGRPAGGRGRAGRTGRGLPARGRRSSAPAQLQQASEAARRGDVWLFSSSQAIAHLRALLPQQDWSRGARRRDACAHCAGRAPAPASVLFASHDRPWTPWWRP